MCTLKERGPLRDESGLTEEEFLRGYDMTKYPRPSVTVDTLIFGRGAQGELTLLLIKRRNHPFIGKWAFPGGFLNMDESPEHGALRELMEETGVACASLRQIGAYGRVERDPRGRIITIAYMALLPEGAAPAAADDAADADLFAVSVEKEERVIVLHSESKGVTLRVGYDISEGKALFIGSFGMAGDHAQILADALLIRGEL